jgi:hypothetical protein
MWWHKLYALASPPANWKQIEKSQTKEAKVARLRRRYREHEQAKHALHRESILHAIVHSHFIGWCLLLRLLVLLLSLTSVKNSTVNQLV